MLQRLNVTNVIFAFNTFSSAHEQGNSQLLLSQEKYVTKNKKEINMIVGTTVPGEAQ